MTTSKQDGSMAMDSNAFWRKLEVIKEHLGTLSFYIDNVPAPEVAEDFCKAAVSITDPMDRIKFYNLLIQKSPRLCFTIGDLLMVYADMFPWEGFAKEAVSKAESYDSVHYGNPLSFEPSESLQLSFMVFQNYHPSVGYANFRAECADFKSEPELIKVMLEWCSARHRFDVDEALQRFLSKSANGLEPQEEDLKLLKKARYSAIKY